MPAADTTSRFEQAVLVHLDAAYNLARWLMHNEHDAQDVVQDACIRALKSMDQFRGGDARAWLLTIVRNCCLSRLGGRRTTGELNDALHASESPDADPQTVLLRAADAERVRHAIASLPAELRVVIVLREMEGMSYKEVAAAAAVPIGTVMSRLSRGRERLAVLLAEPSEIGEAS